MQQSAVQHNHLGGVSVIAFVLLLAFAVDRVTTGLLFVLSYIEAWRRVCPDPLDVEEGPARRAAEKRAKFIYFCIAGVLSGAILALVGGGVLHNVGFQEGPLDTLLTLLILMGGSERVSAFVGAAGLGGGEKASPPPPVEIRGRLIIEEGSLAKAAAPDKR